MTTTPPQNGPGARDDEDPTGMRALLGSLPDPGPMPDNISRSISDALTREQQARAGNATQDAGTVTPMVRGEHRKAGISRWQRAAVSLGAAAAVAAVAVIGVSALQNRQAPTTAVPQGGSSTSDLQDKLVVENTGTDYTKSGLAMQAAALTKGSGPTLAPGQVKQIGAMATRAGILACMQSIGQNLLDNPDKITVDIARYQGKPAVIVVVAKAGSATAWVVSRTCTSGEPPLAGPTAVTT